jgi:hypothetical protein
MSDGELRHRFDSIDKRFESVDKRLDRMATVDMVTTETSHTRDKITEVDRDSRERDEDMEKANAERFKRTEERGQNTWVRILGVLGIAATLVAAAWAAYMSSRGAH